MSCSVRHPGSSRKRIKEEPGRRSRGRSIVPRCNDAVSVSSPNGRGGPEGPPPAGSVLSSQFTERTVNSILLFWALLAEEVLGTTGAVSPYPMVDSLLADTP